MSAINVQNLAKSFDSIQALNNISLDIEQGEIFGFLGPNGAGKSITIRCIIGAIFPDSDKITVDNNSVINNSYKY